MRILIAEDDLTSRIFMEKFLSRYGDCDLVKDGLETIDYFNNALLNNTPYDLICLDIMMPKLDGLKALAAIRAIESERYISKEKSVKIIMTTALNDSATVKESYENGCEAFVWKPIDIQKFKEVMVNLELIKD